MSKLFDTHSHLCDSAFQDDFEDVLQRSLSQCGAIMTIGCESIADFEANLSLSESHPQIFSAIALHPENAPSYNSEIWERITTYAKHPKIRAVGETGLDYHWMTSEKSVQIELFQRHIELAKIVKKPLIIHNRDAHRDTLDTLWHAHSEDIGGVFHAYSGSVEMMKEITQHGFYIGLGGVVTFKNAKTAKEVAREVPLEYLLIETDCPYLTPTPYRGKRNEPSYIRYVAATIADLRGISYDEVVEATWQNACRLYQLNPDTLTII